MSSLFGHFCDILFGRASYLTRTTNPFQILGSVTVFCCLDNEGILSENEQSADHILLLDNQEKPIVLDLLNDPDSTNGIQIEGEWHSLLSSLKPLTLNCILNNTCNFSNELTCAYEFTETPEAGASCLCLLGKYTKWIMKFIYMFLTNHSNQL
jgi:hypothetical protein